MQNIKFLLEGHYLHTQVVRTTKSLKHKLHTLTNYFQNLLFQNPCKKVIYRYFERYLFILATQYIL